MNSQFGKLYINEIKNKSTKVDTKVNTIVQATIYQQLEKKNCRHKSHAGGLKIGKHTFYVSMLKASCYIHILFQYKEWYIQEL